MTSLRSVWSGLLNGPSPLPPTPAPPKPAVAITKVEPDPDPLVAHRSARKKPTDATPTTKSTTTSSSSSSSASSNTYYYCEHCGDKIYTTKPTPIHLPIDISTKVAGEWAFLDRGCEDFIRAIPVELRPRRSDPVVLRKALPPDKRPHPGRSMSEVLPHAR